jgi:hypothetical protein
MLAATYLVQQACRSSRDIVTPHAAFNLAGDDLILRKALLFSYCVSVRRYG